MDELAETFADSDDTHSECSEISQQSKESETRPVSVPLEKLNMLIQSQPQVSPTGDHLSDILLSDDESNQSLPMKKAMKKAAFSEPPNKKSKSIFQVKDFQCMQDLSQDNEASGHNPKNKNPATENLDFAQENDNHVRGGDDIRNNKALEDNVNARNGAATGDNDVAINCQASVNNHTAVAGDDIEDDHNGIDERDIIPGQQDDEPQIEQSETSDHEAENNQDQG